MKRSLGIAIVSLVLLTGLAAVEAQNWVRVDGRVLWVAGDRMMLVPVYGGNPVNVDLKQVSQDVYVYLAQGTAVTVIGVVSPDGRRLIASTVTAGTGYGSESP